LADVCEGVGHGPLEDLGGRHAERLVGGEARVQLGETGMEPLDLRVPVLRVGVVPVVGAGGEAEHPVEEVTDVSEDPHRRA